MSDCSCYVCPDCKERLVKEREQQSSPAGERAQETPKAPSTGHCPVCGESIYGAAHLGCWSRMLARLREHGFAVVRDVPSLPPERAALVEQLAKQIANEEASGEDACANLDLLRAALAALRGETGDNQ